MKGSFGEWFARVVTAPSDASCPPGLLPSSASSLSVKDGLLREAKQGVLQLPRAQDSCKFVFPRRCHFILFCFCFYFYFFPRPFLATLPLQSLFSTEGAE